MAKTYKTYLPDQDLLLPPSLRDWLPENHLVYCVSDVVDELDLSAIESVYEEEDRGQPPYHPRMMVKILVYGYCVGVFSSRRIQKRLAEDVAFRVLAAGNPDHIGFSETSFESAGRTVPAGVAPGVRDGSAEVGTSGFGWEQSKSQREQAQGHELWTDGGGREAAAGGSARVVEASSGRG